MVREEKEAKMKENQVKRLVCAFSWSDRFCICGSVYKVLGRITLRALIDLL